MVILSDKRSSPGTRTSCSETRQEREAALHQIRRIFQDLFNIHRNQSNKQTLIGPPICGGPLPQYDLIIVNGWQGASGKGMKACKSTIC